MKAGFYSPYLDVVGGAEKHLLTIAYALNKLGYQVIFFSDQPDIKNKIIVTFGPRFNFIHYQTNWPQLKFWQRYQTTKQFDLFFYQTDGSYFFSGAKKNFAYLTAPTKELLPKKGAIEKLKFSNWQLFYNSNYVKRYFSQKHSLSKGYVIYPLLEIPNHSSVHKQNLIISVGRFFSHLHHKRHDLLIKAFIYARKNYPEFKDFHLLIAGSYKPEDSDYLKQLQKLSHQEPSISIETNLTHQQISEYYQQALFYWHAAGYDINAKKYPEKAEHFGITITEAMANGCVPLAYQVGGPKEIIRSGKTGYLYQSRIDLIKKTLKLIRNPLLRKQMASEAKKRAKEKFGEKAFIKSLNKMING